MRTQHKWRGQPVFAAGYLLRCKNNYLLIREKGRWSDLGGKCERCDRTPRETARREAEEESKNTFPDISSLPHEEFYNRKSKYLLYVVDVEDMCDVQHPLCWVRDPPRNTLHPRLRYHPRRLSFMRRRPSAIPFVPTYKGLNDANTDERRHR